MADAAANGVKCSSVRLLPSLPRTPRTQRRLIVLNLAFVSFGSFVVAAQQSPTTFRAGIDLVNIGLTVTDNKGALVTGLAVEDFVVTEDGRPQTIRYFAGGDGSGPAAP